MRPLTISSIFSIVICLICCAKPSKKPQLIASYKVEREFKAYHDKDTIFLGGYGSAMAYDNKNEIFYLLTDRGPNVDGPTDESKLFPILDFIPSVAKFRIEGDSLKMVEKIPLIDLTGKPFTGMPNREGDGVTGEVAYDYQGNIYNNTLRGIDSEGFALESDGSFWVSEEYAPLIIKFDAKGQAQKVLSPGSGIPKHYGNRRPNRGMEGICLSKDGKKLYGIMQAPLYLPDSSTKNKSKAIRILELDIASGESRDLLYMLDDATNDCCDIMAINDTELLVIERDGDFTQKHNRATKLIYKINIEKATDVTDLIVENLSFEQLSQKSIRPVSKKLFIDVISAIPDYPHDKLEGLALVNENTLAIVNDDDFGVDQGDNCTYIPKRNPKGEVDRAIVYMIKF